MYLWKKFVIYICPVFKYLLLWLGMLVSYLKHFPIVSGGLKYVLVFPRTVSNSIIYIEQKLAKGGGIILINSTSFLVIHGWL